MRVAFDASSTRGRKTGIGVFTVQLCGALNKYAPQIETVLLDDGIGVEQRTDQRILREQFTLPQLAQNAKANLLHLTGFAAPLRSSVPVIMTVMDLIGVLFSENFTPASRFYWSRYLPFTLRAARHIITLSENTKRDVLKIVRLPAERITVIPPGVDARFQKIMDSEILQAARTRLNLPEEFFLFVSTLEPRKGVDTLIRAFAEIAPSVHEHLILVGKRGWAYENYFELARALDLASRVHFLDYVSDQDLPCVYNLATAFVFPSRYEGFGLAPLEAMACGTPVISSSTSSLPEVIGDAGILVPSKDVDGFARAMRDLSQSESLQKNLSAKGLERAAIFSWKRSAEQTAQVYLVTMTQKSAIENLS